jgi:hypothetical protein
MFFAVPAPAHCNTQCEDIRAVALKLANSKLDPGGSLAGNMDICHNQTLVWITGPGVSDRVAEHTHPREPVCRFGISAESESADLKKKGRNN